LSGNRRREEAELLENFEGSASSRRRLRLLVFRNFAESSLEFLAQFGALFNGRVALEADYYYKKTTNLLLNKPIPTSTGFGGVLSNIGSMSNQGTDIMLTTRNIEGRNFTWTTSFTGFSR